MHAPPPASSGFKRQIVFRIGAEDWPLLETAAQEHGSIQAAVIAGLRALARSPTGPIASSEPAPRPARTASGKRSEKPSPLPKPKADPGEELSAREAGALLGLKTSTIRGYIRSGRLAGRYESGPSGGGWRTTRGAVADYAKTRHWLS